MWYEHAIILFFVALAVLYLAWVFGIGFRGSGGACGCGPKKGCARMEEAMREAGRRRR